MDPREKGYHDPLPHIAMQPPYWMHRDVLRSFILHGRQIADAITPFIDWYMVQVAYAAGIKHKSFLKGRSFATNTERNNGLAEKIAGEGCDMFHSVKTKDVFDRMIAARKEWDRKTGRGEREC